VAPRARRGLLDTRVIAEEETDFES